MPNWWLQWYRSLSRPRAVPVIIIIRLRRRRRDASKCRWQTLKFSAPGMSACRDERYWILCAIAINKKKTLGARIPRMTTDHSHENAQTGSAVMMVAAACRRLRMSLLGKVVEIRRRQTEFKYAWSLYGQHRRARAKGFGWRGGLCDQHRGGCYDTDTGLNSINQCAAQVEGMQSILHSTSATRCGVKW